jgi:hypothetical protein
MAIAAVHDPLEGLISVNNSVIWTPEYWLELPLP